MKRLAWLFASICFLLSSCSKSSSIPPSTSIAEKEYFSVTWKNYDGTVLEFDEKVEKGTMPTYDGPTPTKQATSKYDWVFNEWSPNIKKVNNNQTYTASFIMVEKEFTVTWKNYDNSVLHSSKYCYGDKPIYLWETPTRPSDSAYDYTFTGWSPEVKSVVEDATYIATFKAQLHGFTVSWLNYDGSLLKKDTGVQFGTMPHYDSLIEPTRPDENGIHYVFTGWSPEISMVVCDAIYTAQYQPTTAYYSVTWKNYDGTVLEKDDNLTYGTMPEYNGDTPLRQPSVQSTYTFAGWSPEIIPVTKNATYTAQFSSSTNKYVITWKNYDGTILATNTCDYGTIPVYSGPTPTKRGATFKGWTPSVKQVTSDATYIAQFETNYLINDDILFDNQYAKMILNNVSTDILGYYRINITFINKSNFEVMICSEDEYLNTYKSQSSLLASVAANDTIAEDIFIMDDLTQLGGSIDIYEFRLRVYEKNNFSADDLINEVFTIYPTGLMPSEIEIPNRKTANTEAVVYSDSKYKAIFLEHDASSGIKLNFYWENNDIKTKSFGIENENVNNISFNSYTQIKLASGKKAYEGILYGKYSLEGKGISVVNKIEFDLFVKDENDYLNKTKQTLAHVSYTYINQIWTLSVN